MKVSKELVMDNKCTKYGVVSNGGTVILLMGWLGKLRKVHVFCGRERLKLKKRSGRKC